MYVTNFSSIHRSYNYHSFSQLGLSKQNTIDTMKAKNLCFRPVLYLLCDHFILFRNNRNTFREILLERKVKIHGLYHSFSPTIA